MFSISLEATAAPGQLDPTFGDKGIAVVRVTENQDYATGSLLQSDGKLVVAGTCATPYRTAVCVSRLNRDGSQDVAFGEGGLVSTEASSDIAAVGQLLDGGEGRILLVASCKRASPSGFSDKVCILRYMPNGSLDEAFGINGVQAAGGTSSPFVVVKAVVQEDEKIVVLGKCTENLSASPKLCIARLAKDGSPDATFGVDGFAILDADSGWTPLALLVDSGNRITAAGDCVSYTASQYTTPQICVMRVTASGAFDAGFGVLGKAVLTTSQYPSVTALASSTGGRILVVNACYLLGANRFCVDALTDAGVIDSTFGAGGHIQIPAQPNPFNYYREDPTETVRSISGQLHIAGVCYRDYLNNFCVKRLTNDWTLDVSFGVGGSVIHALGWSHSYANSVTVQADGKIFLSGPCATLGNNDFDFCVVRLKGGPYDPLTCTLNVDANNAIESPTDALLILRYLLGYRGDALSSGVLGNNPNRTGQALETYLASLNLDADGDGQSLATTDGLLILRAMLGLTGDALTAGAVNTAHPNVRNAQQILTWIESTHGVACLP